MVNSALGGLGLWNEAVLAMEASSYCASQGILMATKGHTFTHAPVCILPNDFPASQYGLALRLAALFNTLVSHERCTVMTIMML